MLPATAPPCRQTLFVNQQPITVPPHSAPPLDVAVFVAAFAVKTHPVTTPDDL